MGLQELFPLNERENRAAFSQFVQYAYEQFKAFEAKPRMNGWGTVIVQCEVKMSKADVVSDHSVDRTKIDKPKPLH